MNKKIIVSLMLAGCMFYQWSANAAISTNVNTVNSSEMLNSSDDLTAQAGYYELSPAGVKEVPLSTMEMFAIQQGQSIVWDPNVNNGGWFPDDSWTIPEEEVPPTDPGMIVIDDIINLGERIWKIVVANKPVVNVQLRRASAVPTGIEHWLQLDSWSDPVAKKYQITYKNAFGMTVTEFEFILTYVHSGAVNGTGKFLSEVGFMVSKLNVVWGFTFNAESAIVRTVNVGTRAAPIAGMEVNLSWTVDTVIKHAQQSQTIYLRGDGKMQEF